MSQSGAWAGPVAFQDSLHLLVARWNQLQNLGTHAPINKYYGTTEKAVRTLSRAEAGLAQLCTVPSLFPQHLGESMHREKALNNVYQFCNHFCMSCLDVLIYMLNRHEASVMAFEAPFLNYLYINLQHIWNITIPVKKCVYRLLVTKTILKT